MTDNNGSSHVRQSKRLSWLLRHDPAAAGLILDANGWVDVDELLAAMVRRGWAMTATDLADVVATSDKQRFTLDAATNRIRANQGHSVPVDLDLTATDPPPVLFHGTVERFLPGIRERGLLPGQRHHVHLSADGDTAERVGGRRGVPVVLSVDASGMVADGVVFYRSVNGVWLTDRVPANRITFPDDSGVEFAVGLCW